MGTVQRVWKTRATDYARRINEYVANGEREGWKTPSKQPGFREDRSLAEAALAAVRQANQAGTVSDLRPRWPPAHHLLLPLLDEKGQDIPALFVLDDGGFVARVGAPYHDGQVVEVHGNQAVPVEGVHHIGRSPNRRYFALADARGVRVTDGWGGIEVCACPWPTGLEGVPKGVQANPLLEPPSPDGLVPFPDGKRVLLACQDGVFVLAPRKATRLLPRPDFIRELAADSPEAPCSLDDSMAHAALSPDGNWIAAGSQCAGHYIFDRRLHLSADIGHLSEYPHHACSVGIAKR